MIDTGHDVPSTTAVDSVRSSRSMPSAASRGREHSAGSRDQTYSSVRREMSSLFGQTRSGSGRRGVSVAQTSRSQRRVSAAPYSRVRLISRLFCVLSCSTDTASPDTAYFRKLECAGLGVKQIQMRVNESAEEIHSRLVEAFPQLVSCGGYEVLRACPGSKSLQPLAPLSVPLTAEYLSTAVRSSTKIYLRPIQRDIPLDTPGFALENNSATETAQVNIL